MIPSYIVPKYNHLIKKLFACRLKKWNNRQITSFISCPNIFASTCSTQISVSQISVPDPFPAQATQISVITFFSFLVPTFFVASFKTQELISNFCASPFHKFLCTSFCASYFSRWCHTKFLRGGWGQPRGGKTLFGPLGHYYSNWFSWSVLSFASYLLFLRPLAYLFPRGSLRGLMSFVFFSWSPIASSCYISSILMLYLLQPQYPPIFTPLIQCSVQEEIIP